jgi:histidinol-phosphate/aromatic aminotransferase/cobyric acid decarboxylase-like protein
MVGSVVHPKPNPREVRAASAERLAEGIAAKLGVDPARVFLTHGATEANAGAILYRARSVSGRAPRLRVRYPEYPPLFEVARWAGYQTVAPPAAADLAVVSLPRNPEGVLWSDAEFSTWSEGARTVLVDETFREFARTPSRARAGRAGLWVTGSFTKFYAADDIRVGFVVPPPEEAASFARFHGLVTDELPPYSVAAAERILSGEAALARRVRRVFESNRIRLTRALPAARGIQAPIYFDRVSDGDRLARRCLAASVLVCPGSFFGVNSGVRLSLTRRTFPRDLAAYLRVRAADAKARSATGAGSGEAARPLRGETAPARAGRG